MNNQPTREKLYSQSKGYGFSPALERTRKPFAVRNILSPASCRSKIENTSSLE